MNKEEEKLEQEIATNSYRADQHEENEMVINSSRVLEILSESSFLRTALTEQKKEFRKEQKEACYDCKFR